MGRYNFTSPGAEASAGIREQLMLRAASERQAMLDKIQQDREARLEESSRRQFEEQQLQHDRAQAWKMYEQGPRGGAGLAPTEAQHYRDIGMGPLLTRGQPTQGKQIGEATELGPDIPLYDVEPGIQDFTETPAMRQQRETKAETERKTLAAQQRVQNLLLDPNVPDNVKQFIQAQQASGDTSLPYQLFEDPSKDTMNVYRTDRETGQPTLTGTVPKGSHFTAEPGPPMPFIVNVPGVGLVSVPRSGGGAGAASPVTIGGQPIGGLPENADPAWANVIERTVNKLPANERQQYLAGFGRALERGNMAEVAQQVMQAAREGEEPTERRGADMRASMLSEIGKIRGLVSEMQKAGVPTNILSGSLETIARTLGTSTNPKYVEFANRVGETMTAYQRAATGLAATDAERKVYIGRFPSLQNTATVNMALLNGLEQAISDQENLYWSQKFGPQGGWMVQQAAKGQQGAGGGGAGGRTTTGGGPSDTGGFVDVGGGVRIREK
jgi:hypothetical protein